MAKINNKKLGIGVVMGVTCMLIAGGLFGIVQSAMSEPPETAPHAHTVEGHVMSGVGVGEAASTEPQKVDCDFAGWIGKPSSEIEAVVKSTGRPYRILLPGSAMTMDYRADRINVELDKKNIVKKVTCG